MCFISGILIVVFVFDAISRTGGQDYIEIRISIGLRIKYVFLHLRMFASGNLQEFSFSNLMSFIKQDKLQSIQVPVLGRIEFID